MKISKRILYDLIRNVLASIGGVWAVYNAAVRSVPDLEGTLNLMYPWVIGLAIVIAIYFTFLANRQLNHINLLPLSGGNYISASVGNLFKKLAQNDGINIVIPVNDFFDTQIGETISSKSVHGQFLIWCDENDFMLELNRTIGRSLSNFPYCEETKKKGRTRRYGSEAYVRVKFNENYFYLVPVGTTDQNTFSVLLDWQSFASQIQIVCTFIREGGNGRVTYFPLIGDKLSRTGLPSITLLQQMITSIWRSDKENPIGSSVEIVLYERDDTNFNLKELKHWIEQVGFV